MAKILPKYILAAGSILVSVFTGLNMMGLIPFGGLSFTTGIMMITFGLVVAIDFFNEKRNGITRTITLMDLVALTLIIPAFCFGIISFLDISLIGWEKLMGFVFIALSIAMGYSIVKEE